MKHFFLLLLVLCVPPLFASGHTSDQRYHDGYIVDLSSAPVAPWVGEKVGLSFVFRDPISGLATSSIVSAEWSVDALMRENNKTQETIFVSSVFEVRDGGFVTDYVFTEEGTYDMHLIFTDVDGKERTTGFRKQVRNGAVENTIPAKTHVAFLSITLIFSILGFVLGRFSRTSPKV